MGSKAKYHHLIPQTYMSAWANNSGTLLVKEITSGTCEEKNKENAFGINHYHSIIAGMPLCTAEDAKEIFATLQDYVVTYQGSMVSDPLELNAIYYDYDNWKIKRKTDGSAAPKKRIKNDIDEVKIRDIESAWSEKYENKWPAIREEIERNVLSIKSPNGEISEFQKDFLMKFYTSMDWRSFATDQMFTQHFDQLCKGILPLDQIEIPQDERELPIFETAYDYMKHCLLLKFFRRFLNEEGPMYQHALMNLQHTNFHFLIADGPAKFVTSDNPSFWYTRDDGLQAGLMPITPCIMLVQGRKSDADAVYCVTHITDKAVEKYNKIIEENANHYIILNNSGS